MDHETYMSKRERRDTLAELVKHPGYAILMAELDKMHATATEQACKYRLPANERDAAAGAREALTTMRDYAKNAISTLDLQMERERKK